MLVESSFVTLLRSQFSVRTLCVAVSLSCSGSSWAPVRLSALPSFVASPPSYFVLARARRQKLHSGLAPPTLENPAVTARSRSPAKLAAFAPLSLESAPLSPASSASSSLSLAASQWPPSVSRPVAQPSRCRPSAGEQLTSLALMFVTRRQPPVVALPLSFVRSVFRSSVVTRLRRISSTFRYALSTARLKLHPASIVPVVLLKFVRPHVAVRRSVVIRLSSRACVRSLPHRPLPNLPLYPRRSHFPHVLHFLTIASLTFPMVPYIPP